MNRLAFLLCASAAAAPMAFAAELPLPSRIDAVTVFPDAAAVTRVGEAKVPAGQHVLLLKGLPPTIDPASIRIEGAGDGALTIGSADIRRVAGAVPPNEEAAKKLRELKSALARAQGRIEAFEAQKRAVAEFARIAAEAAVKEGKGFDIAQARIAWAAVGEGTAAANEALQEESRRAADIEVEIKALETASGRQRMVPPPQVDLAIAVEAARELSASLKVTYRVSQARWTPIYDAVLDTAADGAAARVKLVRRASVMQRTGEDWADVALTLSTARVTGGSAAPEVMTQALGLREPLVAIELDAARRERRSVLPAPAPMMAAPAMAPAQEREASASVSAFSASFAAPGRVSVGQGDARAFRLSTHELDAALTARTAPALELRAYLSASMVWTDEVPLLAGEASLTRDGVFVGKARLGDMAPGERFELGFGPDDRIKVERVPVRRRDNDPSGWNAARTQVSDHRTMIANLHKRPMRISVIDRIPVSENSAVVIEPLATNTAATEKSVQDRRGVMGWTHDYAPGEKREIRLGWRLRWPADRDLVGQ